MRVGVATEIETHDHRVALTDRAVGNGHRFVALCLQVPELPDEPRFAGNDLRVGNRAELRSLLEDRLGSAPAAQSMDPLLDRRRPASSAATTRSSWSSA